jgi:hypothetical protein
MKDMYSWDDVFSKNTKQLAEELKIAREAGLISKRTALKRYLSLDDTEVDVEFALLEEETAQVPEVVLPVTEEDAETD